MDEALIQIITEEVLKALAARGISVRKSTDGDRFFSLADASLYHSFPFALACVDMGAGKERKKKRRVFYTA